VTLPSYIRRIFQFSWFSDWSVILKPYDASMSKRVLPFLLLTAVCGIANGATLLVTVDGQFSSSDTTGPLVAPNGLFALTFGVEPNPTPLSGTVTSLGFDVPIEAISYRLNNAPIIVTPAEIRFNTLSNGGLFDVTFGSGLNTTEFDFQGAQAFSGTTSAPRFSTGAFALSSWTYSDPAGNFDSQTPASATVLITPAPEPSSIILILSGLVALIATSFRKSIWSR
jgi:hypothetical protein